MDQFNQVVKYILYKSRENNHPVTHVMAAFIAQVIYNPKTNRFYLEDKLSESQMIELKQKALDKIYNKNSPSMKTIHLQISYDTTMIQSEMQRQEKIKAQSMESGKLIDEVVALEVKNAKDFEGISMLYKKIFNFLFYKNKELSLQKQKENIFTVQKEVAAALQSVIPRVALGPFVSLNPSQKVTQLVELSNLVIGIRLFNQQISKGGASLAPIANLTNHQGRELMLGIRKQTFEISELCENYTMIFTLNHMGKMNLSQSQFMKYKDQLTFLRQYLSLVINLQQEIQISQNTIESNQTRYKKEINDLKNLLGTKSSAPKQQVYPKFAILAQTYIQLFQQKQSSKSKVELIELLNQFRRSFSLSINSQKMKDGRNIMANMVLPDHVQIQYQLQSGVQRLLPHSTPDFMQLSLDYHGFCIWSLHRKSGLIIPGKPNLGVYKYKDKNCVFVDQNAVNQFLKNPDDFIEGAMDQCRKNPELIHLLRMDQSFRGVNLNFTNQFLDATGTIKNRLMVDKQSQCPVHFIEKNLDPNYCWNEWELRQKAIQMANIRKRKTKGCQTILSNYRVDSNVQTYLKKQAQTNTMKNIGVDPIRQRNYLFNIRDKNI